MPTRPGFGYSPEAQVMTGRGGTMRPPPIYTGYSEHHQAFEDYESLTSPSKSRNHSMLRRWRQHTTLQKLLFAVLIILSFMFFGTISRSDASSNQRSHDSRFAEAPDLPLLENAIDKLQEKNVLLEQELSRAQAVKDRRDRHRPAQQRVEKAPQPVVHEEATPPPKPAVEDVRADVADHHEGVQAEHVALFDKPAKNMTADMYGPKNARQQAVVDAMKWAWKAYSEHAWGYDELKPISKRHDQWFNLGLTLVDALDTLFLMGLTEEFDKAQHWVETKLQLDQDKDVNLFECTIRVLGGLLSAYTLSGEKVFLEKAVDLGDRLMYAFNQKSGVPFSDVNIGTHNAHKPKWGPDSSTSEVTTIQLEFRELSRLTGDPKYDDAVTKVMLHVKSLPKTEGLVPIFINADTGQFRGGTITFGARGDSYYEYLLKQWLQTSKTDDRWKDMYLEVVEGVQNRLVKKTKPQGWTYIAELVNNRHNDKMDHLVCFLPGVLALGYANGLPQSHLTLAKELIETCNHMYTEMATGLSPEIAFFHADGNGPDMTVKDNDAHNLLRPETVESLFIMHRITKDPKYVEMGWKIFQNFEKYTRIDSGGYSSIRNVKKIPVQYRDKMESFFLGETLKYLFLLFEDSPDLIPLNKFVFNTEAHPLPIYKP
eukprot:m.103913 g.103913  ORF g.103913 m.103913 type:complete len:653 (+) comp27528_c0_seq1:133-2091(+)